MPLCIRNRSLSDFDFYIVRCVFVHSALFLSHKLFDSDSFISSLQFGWFLFGPEDFLSLSSPRYLPPILHTFVFLIHFLFLLLILLLFSSLAFTLIPVCWLKCFQYQYFIKYMLYMYQIQASPKQNLATSLVIVAPFKRKIFHLKSKRERKKSNWHKNPIWN